MSITPMTPLPPVAPTSAAAGGDGTVTTGDAAAPGSFAALVADLLAGSTGPDGPAVPAPAEPTDQTDPTAEAADGTVAAVPAEVLAATVPAWGQVTTAAQPTTASTALPGKVAAAGPAAGGPVAGVLHGQVVTRATGQTPAAGTAPPAEATAPATAPAAAPATDVAGPADTAGAAGPAAPSAATGDGSTGDPAGSDGDRPAADAPQPTTHPAAQPTAQVAAQPDVASTVLATPAVTAPTAPAAPATPVAEVRPAPAMTQVVPEVTRLVSRGDGVHRLTMKLQPEALGEVRVTLTVRDGAVQVQLTGGEHAARALAEGAPELHRVLEMAGAVDARVVVRDLAGQQTATTGHQPGTPDQSYGAQGSGGDASAPGRDGGQQDQHARTRGGAAARDGLTDGATALRPDPVRSAPRGVDLTM